MLWLLLPGLDRSWDLRRFYAIAVVLACSSTCREARRVRSRDLVALGGQVPLHQLAARLVLYRLIYYVLPLVLGWVLVARIAAVESRRR